MSIFQGDGEENRTRVKKTGMEREKGLVNGFYMKLVNDPAYAREKKNQDAGVVTTDY